MYCLITEGDQTIDTHTEADCFLSGLVIATLSPLGMSWIKEQLFKGRHPFEQPLYDEFVISVCLQVPFRNSLTMVAVTVPSHGWPPSCIYSFIDSWTLQPPHPCLSHLSYFRHHLFFEFSRHETLVLCCLTDAPLWEANNIPSQRLCISRRWFQHLFVLISAFSTEPFPHPVSFVCIVGLERMD